ncbi:diacylglycerol kinase family protein [Virgibacillus chiguensis]|uniref:diacylglycerol kinase family protein n=1 Tax=Virgibacillus chiguensis TaxID=411959 RepID=UPI000A077AF9|nr:diacylglycerol kinase family protein [Virgibacillus chiguensis]
MKDKKRLVGFSFAWQGIKFVVKNERNFRVHLCAAIVVILAGIILNINITEWSIILLLIGNVFITEMLNTVAERIIDYVKPDVHPAAKQIKDVAAGSVLIAAIIAVIVGCFIFIPKVAGLM